MNLVQEIKKKLVGPTKHADMSARYIGAQKHPDRKKDEQSKLIYWGGGSGPANDLSKYPWPSLKDLLPDQQWDIWMNTWYNSNIFDVKSVAITWMNSSKQKDLRTKKAKELFSMAAGIDNWAHSDTLSGMLAQLLEENPKYFSIYKKWNSSKNPWLRRQSLVGIYCYARLRKKHFPAKQSLALVHKLLKDKHFYVQRGLGWTLREIDRVDSKLQRQFVQKHLHDIHSVAWFAASELYPVPMRRKLVEQRKTHRSQK